jgi:AraC-like DNA-binding protein
MDFEPMADAPFRHSVTPIFDEPRAIRTTLSPGFIFRDNELVRDGDDSVSLVIAQSTKLDLMHRGREVRLGRGEATIFQADAPGRCGSRNGFVVCEIMTQPTEWERRCGRPGDALMRPIGRNSDALELLRGYIRSLERTSCATWVEAREVVRRHLIDLIVLAATPHSSIGESSASAVVAARLRAALDHIASHFSDPRLTVTEVAQSQRISSRYLQRLLEMSGDSFTDRVNELRLQKAFTLLADSRQRQHRISDIALQAGFSDVSHFNRLFRARFGDTPKGVRASFD